MTQILKKNREKVETKSSPAFQKFCDSIDLARIRVTDADIALLLFTVVQQPLSERTSVDAIIRKIKTYLGL